jgi:hypothetical protein
LPKISTIAYNMKKRLIFSTFIILNIAKFGWIYLWMIVTWTSQNWNEKKQKTNTSSKGDLLSTILLFVHNKVNKGGSKFNGWLLSSN